MKIVGRVHEQAELKRYFESKKPEFIAITGRRRVGKTYLIRELFFNDMSFYYSGVIGKNVTNNYQLRRFDEAITEYGGETGSLSQCWADAFRKLRKLLESSRRSRQVIFIDELPWIDAPKSDFLPALDHFWNTFASSQENTIGQTCWMTVDAAHGAATHLSNCACSISRR
jgi:predicted AAA+ superfamily ATPase